MYVNAFWVGVFATLFVGLVLLIALALYLGGKK